MALKIMLKKDKECAVLKYENTEIGRIVLEKVSGQNAIIQIDLIQSIIIHREKLTGEKENEDDFISNVSC